MNSLVTISPTRALTTCLILSALCLLCNAVQAGEGSDAVKIIQSRGADQQVDYASLTKYGPWDDRNYALTADDIKLLAPNEHELHDPIPAFFRVELRKEMPDMRRSGPAQYPRSAVPLFENRYGGLQQETKSQGDERDPQTGKRSRRCKGKNKN